MIITRLLKYGVIDIYPNNNNIYTISDALLRHEAQCVYQNLTERLSSSDRVLSRILKFWGVGEA